MKTPMEAARTRTICWSDPLAIAGAARESTGLDFLRRMIDGELPRPPIADVLNFTLTEADEGRAVFEIEPAEYHYNPIGGVHGGVVATVMDSALGCAVQSQLPAGVGYTTLEIKINMIRAISSRTGRLRAEGRVVHGGRSTAVAEADLKDEQGRVYAHGTTTCLILRPE